MNNGLPHPIRVLLISDFPILSWGLEKILHNKAPRMELAATAAAVPEALAILADQVVHVVVLDLDGDAGIESIARLASASPARVLALTSERVVAVRDSAMLAGARGVLSKKAAVEAFTQAIEQVATGKLWGDRPATSRTLLHLLRNAPPRLATDAPPKTASLTRRECRAVAEIGRDAAASREDLAQRLHISESTLGDHLGSICTKLGLSSRLELFAYAKLHADADNA